MTKLLRCVVATVLSLTLTTYVQTANPVTNSRSISPPAVLTSLRDTAATRPRSSTAMTPAAIERLLNYACDQKSFVGYK